MMPANAAVIDSFPAAVFPCDGNTFVLTSDGSLGAWGDNNNGQLGDGTYIDRYTLVILKNHADLFGGNLTGITTIDGGYGYTIALKDDGSILSAGVNNAGQLGESSRSNTAAFSLVPGVADVARLDAGESHVLVLKGDGRVWSWGDNTYGQLGNGSKNATDKPALVADLWGVRAIAAGGRHSVAMNGMETYAWGDNIFGQLGDGTRNSSNRPVKANITGITDVAAGDYHTLALLDDGTVWAWGGNDYGQLGNNISNSSSIPVRSGDLKNVKDIAAADRYSLALKYDGTVWAWGYNGDGALGTGNTSITRHPEPVQVKGLDGVKKIYATPTGCMAVDIYNNVWVWGRNQYGQLGDGTRTDLYTPVPWFPEKAPWWSATTPTPKPVNPTPTPTKVPTSTPTPAPAPGLGALILAGLGAYLLLGRK